MPDSFIATNARPLRVLGMDLIGTAVVIVFVILVSVGLDVVWTFLFLILSLLIPLRRIAPVTMMFLATVMCGVHFFMFGTVLIYFVAVTTVISVYSVAAFAARRALPLCLLPPVLAIATLLLQAFTLWFPMAEPWSGISRAEYAAQTRAVLMPLSLLLIVAFLAAWALGMLRRGQLAEALRLRERAVQDERTRISREIHDIIAHSLASIITLAEGGRLSARQRPELAVELFSQIGAAGRTALGDVKRLLRAIDSPQQDTPMNGVADIAGMVEQIQVAGTEATIVFQETGLRQELPEAKQLALYRAAQEMLTNMLKHAPGARGEIELCWMADRVQLRAINSLVPGVIAPSSDQRGLVGMRERLAMFDGDLTVTRTGASFAVLVTVPTNQASVDCGSIASATATVGAETTSAPLAELSRTRMQAARADEHPQPQSGSEQPL